MLLRAIPLVKPLCVRCITHYEVLGIPRTATKAEIKKAFLEKAKECHPDLNPDNEKAAVMFQEIQEAHDVLMSSKLRAQYNHQLNQESYYGSQQTHRPEDGPRPRSRVRTHGVHNRGARNDDFHDNHRVNRDNYTYPGAGLNRDYYTDPYSANITRGLADQMHVVYMVGFFGAASFIFAVVFLINGIKDEASEGRHSKYKEADRFWSTLRSLEPVNDTVKYAWSEEKNRLVRADTLETAGDAPGLKEKFDKSLQSEIGELEAVEEVEPVEKKPITAMDVSLLRIEMTKKKAAYLAAKKDYNDVLQLFEEEQKERKTARKKQEVI